MSTQTEQDAVTFATDKPDIGKVIKEFQRCGQDGSYWQKVQLAEDTRYCRWDSQSDDGKKWQENMPQGKVVFPFDGASDVRCFQSDEIVTQHVAVDTNAFWRSQLAVRAIGPEDSEEAGNMTTFMHWLRDNLLRRELVTEVELSSQFRHGLSWAAVHVCWYREIARRSKKVTLLSLVQTAQAIASTDLQQIPEQYRSIAPLLAIFPDLIAREDQTEQAVEVLKLVYRTYVFQGLQGTGLTEDDIPDLSTSKAKKAIKELRDKGETELPWPYLCKNQPRVRALKPWRDIVVNNYDLDIQDHPYIFLPTYMTEATLRGMAYSSGWSETWVNAAAKTKGKMSEWSEQRTSTSTIWNWQSTDSAQQDLIEVVYRYTKQVDENGILCLYQTVFSPHVQDDGTNKNLYAIHELLNYPGDQYPVAVCPRECLDRSITMSRSIPELCLTSQRTMKVQHDSIVDFNSVAVFPPINHYKGTMGQQFKFGPAVPNEVTPGREPKFMEIPTKGVPYALEYLMLLKKEAAERFGLFHPEVHPQLTQLMMEPNVRRFLTAWGDALYMAYRLCRKFAPELVERVTGWKPPPDEKDGQYDVVMHFDVTIFHHDLQSQKMEAISSLIPEDSEGVLNRGKLIEMKARLIDPNWARELVVDKASASEKLYRDTLFDIDTMFTGNQAQLRDASNDPTAETRLNHAKQIVQGNPMYISALEPELVAEIFAPFPPPQIQSNPNPLFSANLQKYFENLSMAVTQQKNKIVGRTGVQQ